jgi:hypothetical protein
MIYRNLGTGFGRSGLANVENVNARTVGRKFQCDGATNPAAATGDYGNLAVESE